MAVLLCDIIKDLINWQILYLQSLLIITSAVSPMTLSLPPTIDARTLTKAIALGREARGVQAVASEKRASTEERYKYPSPIPPATTNA